MISIDLFHKFVYIKIDIQFNTQKEHMPMLAKQTTFFLAITLLTLVLSPVITFADNQEIVTPTQSSHSSQAFTNMSNDLKQVLQENYGPLWFAKPFSLIMIALGGIFKDVPVGMYKDVVHYLYSSEHQNIA